MTVKPRISGQPVSTSTFYMWRCVIAIAHADGMIQTSERIYIQKIIDNMDRAYGLTAEQKATFASDLNASKTQSIPDLLRHINDPAVRGQLIYFGGLLARADGVMDPREEAILKKLHADQMASLDMKQIRASAAEAVASETFRHDLAQQELRPQGGLIAIIDRLMLYIGFDLLD